MPTTDDAGDRVLAIITHLLGLLGPIVNILGPLIVLFAAERESAKQHARRALNWQLSYLIYGILLAIVMVVSIPLMIIGIGFLTLILSILALIALSIADLVFVIIAAVRASEDRLYEYPLTIRFAKDPKRLHPVGRAASEPRSNASKGTQAPKRSSKHASKSPARPASDSKKRSK